MDPAASTPQQPLTKYTPPEDASKYIRTYAKDVAAATNAPAPASTPKPIVKDDTKQVASDTGVSLPEFDASPVNHSSDPSSPKEFKQEVVELSSADSEGIFAGTAPKAPAPQAAPLVPQGSIGVAQTIAPIGVVPLAPQSGEVKEEDREAILARLRAKLASHEQPAAVAAPEITPIPVIPAVAPIPEPAPVLPPTPAQPLPPIPEVPAPIRTAAPNFATLPTPTLPTPQVTPRTEAVRDSILPPQSPSPLHTYSSDFADHIDQQKSSTFSVLAAQSDAGQTPRTTKAPVRNFLPLFAGIAMVVVGIGAIAGAYTFTRQSGDIPTVAGVPSLIQFDESVEVQGTGRSLMSAIADVAGGGNVEGNVIVTYTTIVATSAPTGIPQPGGTLIRNLSLPAPDILLRNIDESSTVGTISTGSESRPFMILKVSSYERTFAGMLAWERTMANDLSVFFPEYSSPAFDTATSTRPAPVSYTPFFSDDVIANYDVRILRDQSGRSLMIYGYRGKNLLIIARNEAAFSALAARLASTGN